MGECNNITMRKRKYLKDDAFFTKRHTVLFVIYNYNKDAIMYYLVCIFYNRIIGNIYVVIFWVYAIICL